MDEITYTHKGWFGLCPVYIAEPGSIDPYIEARRPYLGWLLDLSEIACAMASGVPREDLYSCKVRVTGELEDPFVMEYER